MVLVDTSVWVRHLREGSRGLEALLNDTQVMTHPFVVGELACGAMRNRAEILALLGALPQAHAAGHEEVLRLIEERRLAGKGLGYIDMHLLASALLTAVPLWTLDKRLRAAAASLDVAYAPRSG